MSDQNFEEFRKRVARVQKRGKRRLPRIFSVSGPNQGVRTPWFRFPWAALNVTLALVFALKAMIVLEVGEDRYRGRLAAFDATGFGVKIGKFVMYPDPVTLRITDFARPLVKR